MARYVTVSSVSHHPEVPYEDMAGRLERAEALSTRAARMGADIVASPRSTRTLASLRTMAGDRRDRPWPYDIAHGGSGTAQPDLHHLAVGGEARGPVVQRRRAPWTDRDRWRASTTRCSLPSARSTAESCPVPRSRCSTPTSAASESRSASDLNFRPIIEGLSRNGAEVIFFSSMYRGGLQLRAWALELGLLRVVHHRRAGQIIDMSGVVARRGHLRGGVRCPPQPRPAPAAHGLQLEQDGRYVRSTAPG